MEILSRMDRYTKIVLTVIAGCLIWICAKDLMFVEFARAQDRPDKDRKVVEAEQFVLTSKTGKALARLETGKDAHPSLRFYGKNEKVTRVFIGIDEYGQPRVELSDEKGSRRIGMYVAPDNSSLINLFDKDKKKIAWLRLSANGTADLSLADGKTTRLALWTNADGKPALGMTDEAGTQRIVQGIMKDGTPFFSLRDAKGKDRLWESVSPKGEPGFGFYYEDGRTIGLGMSLLADKEAGLIPGLRLCDSTGEGRVMLNIEPDGSPGLSLFDESGKSRAWFAVAPNGDPLLNLKNKDAKTRVRFAVTRGVPHLRALDKNGRVQWRAP